MVDMDPESRGSNVVSHVVAARIGGIRGRRIWPKAAEEPPTAAANVNAKC